MQLSDFHETVDVNIRHKKSLLILFSNAQAFFQLCDLVEIESVGKPKAKAAEGFDALRNWVKDKMVELGVSALCDDPTALPRPPNSVDDLLSNKILPV